MDGSLSDGTLAEVTGGLATPPPLPLPAGVEVVYAVKSESVADMTGGYTVKKRKFAHTNEVQRRCMLEWLEQPGHFQLLVAPSGSAGGKRADGKKVKKTDGFRALMRHVNTHAGATWSMDITKSRVESFLTSYKKVKSQSQQPTFALNENDRARGIVDIVQKRNALCLFYDRIDALFSNANAPADPVVGNPQTTQLAIPTSSSPIATEGLPFPGEMAVLSNSGMGDARDETAPQDTIEITGSEIEDSKPTLVEKQSAPADTLPPTEEALTVASPRVTLSDDATPTQLALERQRLDLLQEQLAVQKRELEIKELELKQQEDEKRVAMRAELTVKLAQAGKSVAEIKELLAFVG